MELKLGPSIADVHGWCQVQHGLRGVLQDVRAETIVVYPGLRANVHVDDIKFHFRNTSEDCRPGAKDTFGLLKEAVERYLPLFCTSGSKKGKSDLVLSRGLIDRTAERGEGKVRVHRTKKMVLRRRYRSHGLQRSTRSPPGQPTKGGATREVGEGCWENLDGRDLENSSLGTLPFSEGDAT